MQAQIQAAVKEVSALSEERILNTDAAALVDYFASKYAVTVPTLDRDNLVAEHHEGQVTV